MDSRHDGLGRAAQRHERRSPVDPSTHRARAARSVLVGGALTVGAFFAVGPSTAVVAVDNGISGPAALRAGLQEAERLTPPPPRGPVMSAEVREVLDLANAERTSRGIPALGYHEQLTQAAEAHAADQYHRDCMTQLSHTGTDGSNPGQRIARTGLSVRTWGENIACGQRTPQQVMTAWMNSSGHRANILNSDFTHIGISVSRDSDGRMYWVQDFGTPR